VSPFQGGKDHLSHRLIRVGIPRKITVLLLWSLSAFFALLAIFINSNIPIYEFMLVVFGSVIWLGLLAKFLSTKDE